jgi:hypothetical protein
MTATGPKFMPIWRAKPLAEVFASSECEIAVSVSRYSKFAGGTRSTVKVILLSI